MQLSIGVRWAMQYGLAVFFTLAIFAVFVHQQVAERINREARLLTEIQARDLRDSLRTQTEEHGFEQTLEWFRSRIERTVRKAPADLHLGIELVDEQGTRLAAAGSLRSGAPPPPYALLTDGDDLILRAVNLGGPYAFLVTATRAPGGVLQVALDTRRYASNIDQVRDVLLFSAPVMVIVTALLGWLLARGNLRPISQIARTAERITSSTLRESIPRTGSGDELDRLAATLNAMFLRIRQGVDSMARFNANAAHQIRSPLNRICSQIDSTLQKPREAEEYQEVLAYLLEQSHQLAQAVHGLLELARSEAGLDPARISRVEIRPMLETLLEFFEPLAEDHGIRLTMDPVPDAVVEGEASWLRQLFSNLLDNAIKYGRPGDEIRVHAEWHGEGLQLKVTDDGPGIPPERLATLFERFERGEVESKVPGFGLGLAIVKEITRAHGGRIEVESELGRGTTFRVWLPTS